PAPAQGAVVVVANQKNKYALDAANLLNNTEAFQTTYAERMFLRGLEGGCSAPIAAKAEIKDDRILLNGNLFSLDGKKALETTFSCPVSDFKELGQKAAEQILEKGGKEMMRDIKKVTSRPGKA